MEKLVPYCCYRGNYRRTSNSTPCFSLYQFEGVCGDCRFMYYVKPDASISSNQNPSQQEPPTQPGVEDTYEQIVKENPDFLEID